MKRLLPAILLLLAGCQAHNPPAMDPQDVSDLQPVYFGDRHPGFYEPGEHECHE